MFLAAIGRFVHGIIIGTGSPFPSPADGLYLVGYILFLVGAIQFLRARETQPDRDGWIDALIVGAAFAVLEWVVILLPYLQRTDAPASARALNAIYSLLTIALLTVTFRVIMLRVTGNLATICWGSPSFHSC